MKARQLFITLALIAGANTLWAPTGSGDRGQEFPFRFNFSSWEKFEMQTLIAVPYTFNGPAVQFSPLLAYLYFQYALVTGLDKIFKTADQLSKFLTLNHVSHTIKPLSNKTRYEIIFESNILGIRTPSAAVQAAAPLLGKKIVDTLTPSPILTWLESVGGLAYVEKYLNLTIVYLLNKENDYQATTPGIPTYLAPHLWRQMKLEKDDIENAFTFSEEDIKQADQHIFKGTLFELLGVDFTTPRKRLAEDLETIGEVQEA